MLDMMFKATDKAAWDAFAETLPDGVLIDEIGPIGEDVAYHVNLRIIDGTIDAAKLAEGYHYVQWIDPATVDTPARIWAGGMSYWIRGGIK